MEANLSGIKPQLFGNPLTIAAIARFLMLVLFALLMVIFGVLTLPMFIVLLTIYAFLWLVG